MNGVNETNPLPAGTHDYDLETIRFDELTKKDRIVLERLRLVTDPFLSFYDVSYFHAKVNGTPCEIVGFPYQIPKKDMFRFLVDVCKKHKLYIKDITNPSKISRLGF